MNKFWKWVRNKAPDPDNPDETIEERTLFLDGTIASESWFDDDVTPALFKSELNSGKGDITVWINSPGGDCFAAAQIYNMLRDYAGKVTVKIDGIAASAASVIAMAGDTVLVSPVSMIMIHNPATIAMGDHNEMQKAIEMLDSVKDSIINAYALKTGLSHNKLAVLMENETWMDAREAVKLKFADDVISRNALHEEKPDEEEETPDESDEENGEKENGNEKPRNFQGCFSREGLLNRRQSIRLPTTTDRAALRSRRCRKK
jgi:ATP-dependent Clp protease protease subunit